MMRIVFTALAIALSAAPGAGADDSRAAGAHAVVTPATGELVGEVWAQLYSLPVAQNPFVGNGDPCLTVGHKVIQAISGGPCTIKQGWALTLGRGMAWSSAEDPFPETRAEQLSLAEAADQAISRLRLTVDGGAPIEIRRRRFEVFSPQRTVQLPADNVLGVPAQRATLSAHAWAALVTHLCPGRHVITLRARFADGTRDTVPHVITVVRGRADPNHPGVR